MIIMCIIITCIIRYYHALSWLHYQVGIIYLTAIIYSPTSAELKAGLEEEAVMCTSLVAEKVISLMLTVMLMVMTMVMLMLMLMLMLIQVDCGSVDWLSCQEWCLAGGTP